MDLHLPFEDEDEGCTAAVSRVLLHHTLLEFAEGTREVVGDLTVVTGQGHGSGSAGSVLPAATRAFLTEECDPPIEVSDHPNNPGCFVVRSVSIEKWVAQHQQDKD